MFPEEADQLMKMLQQVFVHTVAIVKDRFWQSRQERMMGDFFNGDNMNTYALFVMGHFGTKHLYPLTKIRNCNCIYNFWRPSHMRGGFLFPDIRVERSSSLRSQMLRQRHSFSLACFFPPSKLFTPHHIVVDGFYKGFQEIFEQTLWCYELYHCRNDSDQTNQRCCP